MLLEQITEDHSLTIFSFLLIMKARGLLHRLWDSAFLLDIERWSWGRGRWRLERIEYRNLRYSGPVSLLIRIFITGLIVRTTSHRHTAYLLLLVTGAAVSVSVAQLILTRAFTRMIMHITLILSICLNMCVCPFTSSSTNLILILRLNTVAFVYTIG